MHICRNAPGIGQVVTVWIRSLRMHNIGFTRLQRHRFHWVHNRCLVSLRRLVNNLHVNRVAQAFGVGNRQAEHHGLIAGRSRNVEGRFRFGAVGQGDRWARNLSPFVDNRIAVWIAGRRTIERNGCRARNVLVCRRGDWRMVGHNRINRRRAATQQAFVHGVQDVAGIGVNRPCEQTAQVFLKHVFAFCSSRTRVFIGDQITRRFVEHVWRFCIRVVAVFPAWFAFVLVNDLTIVNHARFPGTSHHTGRGTGERIVTGVAVYTRPAAAIHARTDHDLARLYALLQQGINPVFRGVVGVWSPCWCMQRSLVAQLGVAPAAVEVVAHQEDVVEVLLSSGVVHVFNLIFTGTDCAGQLIGTASLGRQLVQHRAQIVHQRRIGRFILLRVAFRLGHTAAAREFPVDIHTVEEFPGLQEIG